MHSVASFHFVQIERNAAHDGRGRLAVVTQPVRPVDARAWHVDKPTEHVVTHLVRVDQILNQHLRTALVVGNRQRQASLRGIGDDSAADPSPSSLPPPMPCVAGRSADRHQPHHRLGANKVLIDSLPEPHLLADGSLDLWPFLPRPPRTTLFLCPTSCPSTTTRFALLRKSR